MGKGLGVVAEIRRQIHYYKSGLMTLDELNRNLKCFFWGHSGTYDPETKVYTGKTRVDHQEITL